MINTLEESLARGYRQLSSDSLRLQRAIVVVCLRCHMDDYILFMLQGDPGFLHECGVGRAQAKVDESRV